MESWLCVSHQVLSCDRLTAGFHEYVWAPGRPVLFDWVKLIKCAMKWLQFRHESYVEPLSHFPLEILRNTHSSKESFWIERRDQEGAIPYRDLLRLGQFFGNKTLGSFHKIQSLIDQTIAVIFLVGNCQLYDVRVFCDSWQLDFLFSCFCWCFICWGICMHT